MTDDAARWMNSCKELEDECEGYLEGMLFFQAERDELWAVLKQFVVAYNAVKSADLEVGNAVRHVQLLFQNFRAVVDFVEARQRRLDQEEKLLVMELTERAKEKESDPEECATVSE